MQIFLVIQIDQLMVEDSLLVWPAFLLKNRLAIVGEIGLRLGLIWLAQKHLLLLLHSLSATGQRRRRGECHERE